MGMLLAKLPYNCGGHLSHAAIDWPLTLTITALAIAGSLAGARLADRIPAQLMRTGFGWFLTAKAALVLIEQAPSGVRHQLVMTAPGRVALTVAGIALMATAARHLRVCRSLTAGVRPLSGPQPR